MGGEFRLLTPQNRSTVEILLLGAAVSTVFGALADVVGSFESLGLETLEVLHLDVPLLQDSIDFFPHLGLREWLTHDVSRLMVQILDETSASTPSF